jgi:hypothetical protein
MCGMPNSKGRSLKDIGHQGKKLKQIKRGWICVESNVTFTSMWVVFEDQRENNFQHVFLGHGFFGILKK